MLSGFGMRRHTHRNDGAQGHIHRHFQRYGVGFAHEKIETVHRTWRGGNKYRDIFLFKLVGHLARHTGLELPLPDNKVSLTCFTPL